MTLFFSLVITGLLAGILVKLNSLSAKLDQLTEKVDRPKQ